MLIRLSLPDLDSNQDKQSQSLSYYHYTIGQLRWVAKVGYFLIKTSFLKNFTPAFNI